MPLTPQITLTATLDDLSGAAAGSAANPAKLRIALCGFGMVLPQIAGTATLAKVGPIDYLSTGGLLTILLWGNDVITPLGVTYYAITVLDGDDNIVQCGMYEFTGTQTIDLSNATQIVPPPLPPPGTIKYLVCSGDFPGSVYVAPGPVVAVALNGILQRPFIDYDWSGATIAFKFTTQPEDNVYALCIAN